jgi:hypothetical protein
MLVRACAIGMFLGVSSFAAQPQRVIKQDSGTLDICGMTIVYETQGTWSIQRQAPNMFYRRIYLDWQTTYTNPQTGKSVTLKVSGEEPALTLEPTSDGLYILGHSVNTLAYRIVVPGQQPMINVGKVNTTCVFDASTGGGCHCRQARQSARG